MACFKCALYPPLCQILPSLSLPFPLLCHPHPHIALRADMSLNLLLVAVVKSLLLLALSERTQSVFWVYAWTNGYSLSSAVNAIKTLR